ncbi:uncharacterized protein LOC120357016 [Solenopsis invicta]|uniref:uncharacterized protein LOC120357016 n=1 Tax=Solenopsis invicta TaxID=13686 RepID=UPI00193DD213|nr:uncharacterized protein LOC120357016 [Solenopsis invicta]
MSQSLVWHYFIQHRRPVAECNLCNKWYHSEQVLNLEKHLTREHPKVITEIRESIRRANLAKYFVFDVGDSEARCVIQNCIVNIFYGIDNLNNHLNNHKQRNKRKNTNETAPQPTAVEDNTSAGDNNQLTDSLLQDTKNHKELPWGNSHNFVWRYFKPDGKPYAKCSICKNRCKGISLNKLEQHLLHCHTELIDEIQCEIDEEIWRLNLSPYFVCDPELPQIRCCVDNCIYIVNIFHGTTGLKDHLSKCHENICTWISVPRNNTDVMTKQEAEDSNESIQLISAENIGSASVNK